MNLLEFKQSLKQTINKEGLFDEINGLSSSMGILTPIDRDWETS